MVQKALELIRRLPQEPIELVVIRPISGGGGGSAPRPSAEERELQRTQTELLRQQQALLQEQLRRQDLLAPLLFQRSGITPLYDDSGRLIGFQAAPPDPQEQLLRQLSEESLRRALAAQRGELPVPSTIERALQRQEMTLREQLLRALGPGYEQTSAGIEALQKFRESAEAQREAFRHGEMKLAQAMGLEATQESQRLLEAFLKRSASINLLPFGGASSLGDVAKGFGQLSEALSRERWERAKMEAQQSAALASGLGTLGGAVLGGVIGSVVPGIGTAAGAMLGAGLGGAVGTAAGGGFGGGGGYRMPPVTIYNTSPYGAAAFRPNDPNVLAQSWGYL
jgi:hypothetical protein